MAIPNPQVAATSVSDQRLDIDGSTWQLNSITNESVTLYTLAAASGTSYKIGYLAERPATANFTGGNAAPAVAGKTLVVGLSNIDGASKFHVDYDRAFVVFDNSVSSPVNVTYSGMGSIQRAKDINESLLANEWAVKTSGTVTGTSEYSAKKHATDAATSFTNFRNDYLGDYANDSAANAGGATVTVGSLYFNTTTSKLKVCTDASGTPAWANATSAVEGVATITEFSPNGTDSHFAFSHDVGLQIVWLNGVRLIQGTDYLSVNSGSSTSNMTSGTASHIYFTSVPQSGDVLSAMGFGTVTSTAVVPKSGGAFTGAISGTDLTLSGNLTVSGSTTTVDTTVTVSDAMVVNNAGSDVGLKINSTSSGHIMQLQDNGTDVMVVKDGGNVGIGTTSPGALLNLAQAGEPKILLSGYHASAGYSPSVTFERSKHGTLGDNTAVASGDYLGVMLFRGANGSGYNTGAEIRVKATETHTNSAVGTEISFHNVKNGTTTKEQRLTIRDDGNVDIGGASHAARRLSIKSTATDNSVNAIEVLDSSDSTIFKLISDGDLHIPSGKVGIGTSSVDALLHIESTDTPVFQIETTGTVDRKWQLQVVEADGRFVIRDDTAGANRFNIDASGNVNVGAATGSAMIMPDNSDAANPAFGFYGDAGMGMYRVSGDTLGFSTGTTKRMSINGSGTVNIVGAFSKGSGTFKIDHPLESKSKTHNLVHSFIEGPQADLIYRGKVTLVAGSASVNIDANSTMTEGTFSALCREVQSFTTNETGWTAIKGTVNGNILTITAQDETCTDSISWMVIGERKDKHMIETEWTDENGKPIMEPEK